MAEDNTKPDESDSTVSGPFGLPDPAIRHFNAQAGGLFLKVSPIKPQRAPTGVRLPTSASHELPVMEFNDGNILAITSIATSDQCGKNHSRGFGVPEGFVGLEDDAFRAAERLCTVLAAKKELRTHLSERFVADTFFDWLRDRHKGVLPVDADFLSTLGREAERAVRPRKIAHPIAHLVIQKPFTLGKVLFEFFTAEAFDILDKRRLKQWPPDTPEGQESARLIRLKYQGKVCCSMVVTAEPIRCVEIARRETDRALVMLRCFSPTVFIPEIPSYFDRRGMELVPGHDHIIFEEVHDDADPPESPPRLLPRTCEGTDEPRQFWTTFSERDLREVGGEALQNANILLNRERPSELEEQLLTCYTLFARGIRSTDFHERVVFCLVALEALLLKSTTEPIGANMGNRAAFLAYKPKGDRRKAKETISKAYEVRSRFLHHGERKMENMDLLRDLQPLVWCALQNVFVRIAKGCKTRTDLLEQIENELMS